MDDSALEDDLDYYDTKLKQHGVEHANEALRRSRGSEEADRIISIYMERVGKLLHGDRGLVDPRAQGWYLPKPDSFSPRWAYAKTRLGLSSEAVDRTSTIADEILARLGNPKGEAIETRGLVLGYVQSGKTTSFLSVAAKALDNDYDLVIILAGVHNSLRRQTQDRAVRTLVQNRDYWWLGTALGDFKKDGNTLSAHLAGNGKRGLLVVKKHATILKRLADWLEETDDNYRRKVAVLVIDDEADQAGLDVSTGGELQGVHKQLSRIVNFSTKDGHRRCAYLAYTATPYANILTSQEDYGLYPRDFIYPLDKPSSYVGSQEIFGDDQLGDPVQLETDESDTILTSALEDAIRWFVLATAARVGLGSPLESFHSSMLIHTTQKTDDQIALRPVIEAFLREVHDEFEADKTAMRSCYERLLGKVPAREGGGDGLIDERVATWAEVEPHITAVLRRLIDRTPSGPEFEEDGRRQRAHSGVIVDNSKVAWPERLTYSDLAAGQPSVTVIAIGGNTLSRGLTLEGLVCSYFARTSKTYDSLMQMSRWFGYRPGYRHLVRIWTTQTLLDWFRELDLVEQELRDELIWMAKMKLAPDAYGPRIRVSPNLNITRAAAMKSVSKQISYSDHRIDPAWLNLEESSLKINLDLALSLASRLHEPDPTVSPSVLFRDVPASVVEDFIFNYRFHEEEKRVDMPSLKRYLANESDALSSWNVLFKSVTGSTKEFDFGGPVGIVRTTGRTHPKDNSTGFVNSLVGPGDDRIDCGGTEPIGANHRSKGEPPLLIVYAIDSNFHDPRYPNRVALGTSTTPIGVVLVLPASKSNIDYVTPAIAVVDTSDIDMGDYQDV